MASEPRDRGAPAALRPRAALAVNVLPTLEVSVVAFRDRRDRSGLPTTGPEVRRPATTEPEELLAMLVRTRPLTSWRARKR